MVPQFLLSASGATVCGLVSAYAQPCQPYWAALPPNGCNSFLNTIIHDDGTIPSLWTIGCDELWRWNGREWSSHTPAVPGRPNYIVVLDEGVGPRLHLLMRLHDWEETFLRWNGLAWEPATQGLFVRIGQSAAILPRLTVDESGMPVIYGTKSSGTLTIDVVRWNGSSWDIIGTANTPSVALIAHDDGAGEVLYVLRAQAINGIYTGGLARWDGSSWTGLLTPNDRLGTLFAVTSGEVAGSRAIYIMAGRSINGVAQPESVRRWDSQNGLTDIGLPVWYREPFELFEYRDLHIFDDGSGPSLYLGGGFAYDTRELPPRGNIGRWDGQEWHRVGFGLRGIVRNLVSMEVSGTPRLFASGLTWAVGEGRTYGIAQWVGCPNCYANCDDSTRAPALNVDDFTCFINRFAALDPYADCTVDGSLNIDDFLCFINHFAAASSGGPGLNCP